MLRALVVALLLANLGFYAWTQGWLDSLVGTRAIGDREPERLERQVRPEIVRILPADAAIASTPAGAETARSPVACLEAGPFNDAEANAVQVAAQLSLPSGSWVATKVDRPGVWIVYMGKYANREALTKKEEELKRRRMQYEELLDNAALAPGLLLGRYDDRAAATKALDQFAQQGIHTARVVELTPPSSRHMLRVEKADSAMSRQLAALKLDALGKGFVPCAKPPVN